jgi:hypothetical protein
MGYFERSSTASFNGRQLRASCTLLGAACALLSACGPRFVRAPESPLLLVEIQGKARVAMLDGDKMIDVGWIDASELEGMTAVQFDWSAE